MRGEPRDRSDPVGRLAYFEAVPSDAADRGPMDWRVLFQAAGLDPAAFTESEPSFRPPSFADERKSWRGGLPELPGVPVELHAAAYRGRLVLYGLVLEPDVPSTGAVAVGVATPLVRIAGVLMFAAIPIAAALLARQNLRLGRSDRRGAFRVWGRSSVPTSSPGSSRRYTSGPCRDRSDVRRAVDGAALERRRLPVISGA